MKTNTKNVFIAVLIMIVVIVGVFLLANYLTKPTEMDITTFFQHLQNENIEKVEINNATATFKLKNDDKTNYRVYIREERLNSILEDIPLDKQPRITYNDPYAGNGWNYLMYGLMFVGVIFLFFILFRNIGAADRKAVSVGRAGVSSQAAQKVRFSDIAGAEEEKHELSEIVDFLKAPQKFIAAGARIPRGVLLVGPPGTGKTLFAKAVSGEAKVPFFSISGSDFVELYVGVGASRVRDLFDIAKRHKPCIVFIDEIDAVGRRRGSGMGGGHDEREQTLNQLLVQMDGFEPHDDVIILAATNRSDILDPALMRPGRFDRQIQVHAPDVRGREEILKIHARNKKIDADVDFKVLARITSGFTGADIANLLNEAAILAARDNRTVLNMADINEGINKVTLGPQKKSRVVSEFDKRVTAYHEAGHAIVAKSIPESDPLYEVSIIPRGSAGGYTSFRSEDDSFKTTGELKAYLAMLMGGRAAEELVIKDFSIGAQSDIKRATGLAKHMVTEWGMSGLGPIYYGSEQELFLGRDYGATHSYSESIASKIDAEVENFIKSEHARALQILTAARDKLDTMARVLIECETIFADEVDMIMAGASAAEVLEHVKRKFEKPVKENNEVKEVKETF